MPRWLVSTLHSLRRILTKLRLATSTSNVSSPFDNITSNHIYTGPHCHVIPGPSGPRSCDSPLENILSSWFRLKLSTTMSCKNGITSLLQSHFDTWKSGLASTYILRCPSNNASHSFSDFELLSMKTHDMTPSPTSSILLGATS
jgi:hypothetical protein